MKQFWTAIALISGAFLAFGWLAWKCDRDPAINFLPGDSRAEWILFPAPANPLAHRVAMMDAIFRRTWTLKSEPKSVRLLFRAAKRLELKINGAVVQIDSATNWKNISAVDVSNFVRAGSNAIEVRIFNDDAPPALWLTLISDSATLRTDDKWDVSLAGSAWRAAAIASMARLPGPGNVLAGGETIFDALPRIWPTWIGFGIFAGLLALAVERWLAQANPAEVNADLSRGQLFGLIGFPVVAWLVLFWNNGRTLPFCCGYDFSDHLKYIKYIQERGALPLPNEGFEMFQPPLFYSLAAGLLSISHISTDAASAAILLRVVTTIFGIANFLLVFLSVRLLFPRQPLAQLVGLLMAAFLPMQLYLSHYVTNETLAATLVSAAIYVGLRILRSDQPSVSQYLGLGVCTGAAMLAKATSLLLIPPLIGALLLKLVQQRALVLSWLRAIGITLGALLVVCGWHYIRIWRHFGTPIVGNWERAFGFNWWQDPGFHVAADYFRFGRSFISPLFSSFNGFGDGIYSTLWGDALGGGFSNILSRTPWNYNLVVGGYLFAAIPTCSILTGLIIAVYRFVCRSSPELFLLLGFSAAMLLGLLFMTLKVASYAQVKAFYGLSVVVPLCAFAAAGWSKLEPKPRFLRFAIGTAFLFWVLSSYCSVWIRSSAAEHIYACQRALFEQRLDLAAAEAEQALKSEPPNAIGHCLLAAVLSDKDRTREALDHTTRGLQLDANNTTCQLEMAINSQKQGAVEEALAIARRVIESKPENAPAYNIAFDCARQLQRKTEAFTIGQDALAISPYDADLHYRLGLAAGERGDFATVVPQFAYALLLQPSRSEFEKQLHLALLFAAKSANAPDQLVAIASSAPDSAVLENELAWIFATATDSALRNGPEAIRLAERACALTNRKRPKFLATLAAAYAEAGKFSDAVAAAQESRSLARSTGDTTTSYLADRLMSSLQNQQPFREDLSP